MWKQFEIISEEWIQDDTLGVASVLSLLARYIYIRGVYTPPPPRPSMNNLKGEHMAKVSNFTDTAL